MCILGRSTKIFADDGYYARTEEYIIFNRVKTRLNDPTKAWTYAQGTYEGPILTLENDLPWYTQVKSFYLEWFDNKIKLSIIQEDIKDYLY